MKTCPGVWMEVGPVAGGPGWRRAGTPFLQHHLALTDSSAILHFRWKSLVLHLRFDSSMMSSCRRKTRVGLKNCHLDFWRCCAIPVSLEGFETRTKFGPTSFFVPKLPWKTSSSSPNCCRKHPPCHLGSQIWHPLRLAPLQPTAPCCQRHSQTAPSSSAQPSAHGARGTGTWTGCSSSLGCPGERQPRGQTPAPAQVAG